MDHIDFHPFTSCPHPHPHFASFDPRRRDGPFLDGHNDNHWDPFYSYYRSIGLVKPQISEQNSGAGFALPNIPHTKEIPNPPSLKTYNGWTNTPGYYKPEPDFSYDRNDLSSLKMEIQKMQNEMSELLGESLRAGQQERDEISHPICPIDDDVHPSTIDASPMGEPHPKLGNFGDYVRENSYFSRINFKTSPLDDTSLRDPHLKWEEDMYEISYTLDEERWQPEEVDDQVEYPPELY